MGMTCAEHVDDAIPPDHIGEFLRSGRDGLGPFGFDKRENISRSRSRYPFVLISTSSPIKFFHDTLFLLIRLRQGISYLVSARRIVRVRELNSQILYLTGPNHPSSLYLQAPLSVRAKSTPAK